MKKVNFARYYNMKETFVLNCRTQVQNLTEGAKLYGGATMFDNKCYSNYGESSIIDIKKQNTFGILVPSTYNVSEVVDNSQFVAQVVETLEYFGRTCRTMSAQGSWLSENDGIVVEDSTIVLWNVEDDNDFDIYLQKSLGFYIKEQMLQEGVSLFVNDALIIV